MDTVFELDGGLMDAINQWNMESSSSSHQSSQTACINGVNNTIQTVVTCVVDGCTVDLSNCRKYHQRHKVCELHSKSPEVSISGQKLRFCQQCSRFHQLEEFDKGKRSCRKRLDGHNRRRRKPRPYLFSTPDGTNNMLHYSSSPMVQYYPTMGLMNHIPNGVNVIGNDYQNLGSDYAYSPLSFSTSSSEASCSNLNYVPIDHSFSTTTSTFDPRLDYGVLENDFDAGTFGWYE